MKFIIRVLINALVLVALAEMFPAMIAVESFGFALLAGLFITIINGTIRPLLQLLALPISFLTFGIFALIINGISLELAISFAGNQIVINGFFNVIIVSLVLSFVQSLVFKFLNENFKF